MIISTDVEKKKPDKIEHPFLMKTLSKPGTEENFNLIKRIYEKPTANITLL